MKIQMEKIKNAKIIMEDIHKLQKDAKTENDAKINKKISEVKNLLKFEDD